MCLGQSTPPSILYVAGSVVGPYRLVQARRPAPPLASSSMHPASLKRSNTPLRALAPGFGRSKTAGELRSALSSDITPNLVALSGGSTAQLASDRVTK